METKKENLYWIDAVKAICMLAVYLLHSEAYYGTGGISYRYTLMPFYVNGFFVVSGYLFFRSYRHTYKSAEFKKDIGNIFFRMVIPSIIFATIIYCPKIMSQGGEITIQKYLLDVFGGVSFWFVSALAVSQLILRTLLLLNRSIWFYLIVSTIIFAITTYFNINYPTPSGDATAYFPWFYKIGLIYTFIMVLGGLYCKYEEYFDKIIKYGWILPFTIYVYLVYITWSGDRMNLMGLNGRVDLLGFIAIICSVLSLITITKRMPHLKWLTYIGQQSIVFYFLSGAIPAAIGKIANIFLTDKNYFVTVIVALVSLVCSYIITKIIYAYLPFMIDIRKLSIWNRK